MCVNRTHTVRGTPALSSDSTLTMQSATTQPYTAPRSQKQWIRYNARDNKHDNRARNSALNT